MSHPALLFYGDNEKAGLYRTFSHMNPDLFIEAERVTDTIRDGKTAMKKVLEQIGATFGPRQIDPSITEVSSLLPDTLEISIGVLNTSKTYPEREVIANGFRFRVWQETTSKGNFGGQISICKIQPIFEQNNLFLNENEFNFIANQLNFIPDTKGFLKNRAGINSPISNKEGIFIGNIDELGRWLQEMFSEYKKLSIGYTFESLAKEPLLRRNYGFLVWLILHYNKSRQK